MNEAGVQ